MKKLLSILLATLLLSVTLLSLAACGGKNEPQYNRGIVGDFDASQVAAYSIDLTDIEGYTFKVVDGTWAETFDAASALAMKETNATKRFAILHKLEDLLMETGCLVPLYFYTDIYMADKDIEGFYSSPFGYKYFMYTKLAGATDELQVCLSSEPSTIDPALNSSVDGATTVIHVFSGLVKYGLNNAGLLEHQADLIEAIPEAKVDENTGVATYEFVLKDNLKWSDGTALTAEDFVYAWERAIAPETGADYAYMFDPLLFDDGLHISASADGKTFTVECPQICPYFMDLCAFPTFMPVQKATIDTNGEAWATNAATYIGNGPYVMTSWTHGSNFVLEKNPYYHDASAITMDKIVFNLSSDDSNMLANFKSGDWDFIDSVPNAEIPTLKAEYPDEFCVTGQLGTYYIIFNNNKNLLPADSGITDPVAIVKANNEIRRAIALMFDRNYIVEEIGQAEQKPASSFVAAGVTNPDGTQFCETAGGNSYAGYFNTAKTAYAGNVKQAVETLKKYFTWDEENEVFLNVPVFDYLYNTGSGHKAIAEYMQACFAQFGIKMTIANQEWNVFLETRKNGEFTLARNGWLMDYNDPNNMLEMWLSHSGNNDAQFGK
ncbi:MAG: ABC transporter substrate-binding protein [Clostridia bacterium]|nr:ABC transporter substrate-binding protein [Clostridia bacterium]